MRVLVPGAYWTSPSIDVVLEQQPLAGVVDGRVRRLPGVLEEGQVQRVAHGHRGGTGHSGRRCPHQPDQGHGTDQAGLSLGTRRRRRRSPASLGVSFIFFYLHSVYSAPCTRSRACSAHVVSGVGHIAGL